MTKSEFMEWKNHPVTIAAQDSVAEACGAVVGEMVTWQKSDPMEDSYKRGFVRGVQAFMEWEPELEVDDDEV